MCKRRRCVCWAFRPCRGLAQGDRVVRLFLRASCDREGGWLARRWPQREPAAVPQGEADPEGCLLSQG